MQPALKRCKVAASCAFLLFSGCLIEIKMISCETTENQMTPMSTEITGDAVPGKGTEHIVNVPTPAMIIPETHTENSRNTVSTSEVHNEREGNDWNVTLSDPKNVSEDESSVTSTTPLHINLTEVADDQSNSTQVDYTTLGTEEGTNLYSHSPIPSVSSGGEASTTAEPETSSDDTTVSTTKQDSNQATLGLIISISFLIFIILIILICWALRKKTKRYSFDLYHKSAEDANIPLSSVHEDNENGQISSEKKTAPESSQTSDSEDATKAADEADSTDK
uniref:Uncharacterized protein LOC117358278 isoform X2 n=1 Tax=Geotrypetes seraphini TaxID=260995 RepID=A0A6P8R6Z0_GEOSA|nr:uncharacterized protein LOC117358278 isoform X2 [Geotrypetes seraphini]